MTPTLQMRKLRCRGVKYLAQGHPARQYQSSDLNSVWSLPSNPCPSLQEPLYVVGAQEMIF